MTRVPRVTGFSLATLHLACVIAAATWIVVAFPREGESPMLWMLFLFVDFPLGYVWQPLDQFVTQWPDIPFLPPVANNWEAFLMPLLFFGVAGTLWWFLIGWLLGRIFTLIFRFREVAHKSR